MMHLISVGYFVNDDREEKPLIIPCELLDGRENLINQGVSLYNL